MLRPNEPSCHGCENGDVVATRLRYTYWRSSMIRVIARWRVERRSFQRNPSDLPSSRALAPQDSETVRERDERTFWRILFVRFHWKRKQLLSIVVTFDSELYLFIFIPLTYVFLKFFFSFLLQILAGKFWIQNRSQRSNIIVSFSYFTFSFLSFFFATSNTDSFISRSSDRLPYIMYSYTYLYYIYCASVYTQTTMQRTCDKYNKYTL